MISVQKGFPKFRGHHVKTENNEKFAIAQCACINDGAFFSFKNTEINLISLNLILARFQYCSSAWHFCQREMQVKWKILRKKFFICIR